MAIGFDPLDTVWVRLNSFDGGKPEGERAMFEVRHLTSRQVRLVAKLRNEAWDADDDDVRIDKLNEAILMGIAGWKGVKDNTGKEVPFSPDALEDFEPREKSRMCGEYPWAVFLASNEKKTFPSPSASTDSAPATAPGMGSAGVAPA